VKVNIYPHLVPKSKSVAKAKIWPTYNHWQPTPDDNEEMAKTIYLFDLFGKDNNYIITS